MSKTNRGYQALYSRYLSNERNAACCVLCHKPLTNRQTVFQFIKQNDVLCGACRMQMEALQAVLQLEGLRVHALYVYNDFLENMLFQFKEGRDVALAGAFFQPFLPKLVDRFRHWEWVLLPSSKEKFLTRGFLPLQEMLRDCPLPLHEPFYKVSNYKQSLQSFPNRQNVSRVIKRKPKDELSGRRILLVDDVCTSGATLLWAYHLLRAHRMKIEALVLCVHPRLVETCGQKGLLKKERFAIL